MGRAERPLDPNAGPVESLAHQLRMLRQEAGKPTYRTLARRAHYSITALSQAASGTELPSLDVTLAYAQACGGDAAEWTERWQSAWRQLNPLDGREVLDLGSPYRGLAPFRFEDASCFFGREQLIDSLVDQVVSRCFTAVFGPSGCGKTSLLNAGLLPAIATSGSPLGSAPLVVAFTPGNDPVSALAQGLADFGGSVGDLGDWMTGNPRILLEIAGAVVAGRPSGAVMVMVVDQFEEVFTQCNDGTRRDAFICALAAVADTDVRSCPLRVVLGVRADFYVRCAEWPELVAALNGRQLLVGPMSAADLRSAIVKPASSAGHDVETALVSTLIGEALGGGGAGALPMLSHALLETWNRRKGKRLTLANYREAGGLKGAIAQTAQRVYDTFTAAERDITQKILTRLTASGNGEYPHTRRRVRRADLIAATGGEPAGRVLDRLVHARLLTANDKTIEIAHEALIGHWPAFRRWLDEDQANIQVQRELTLAAEDWHRTGHDTERLWRGGRLAGVASWLAGTRARQLTALERDFLEASLDLDRRELIRTKRINRRLRLSATGLALLLITAGAAAGIAKHQAGSAQRARDSEIAGRLAALAAVHADTHPLSLLLSLESLRRQPTDQGRATLLAGLLEPRNNTLAMTGHTATVYDVAFTPDGRYLLSAGEDRTIRVWNTASGTEVSRLLTGHTDPIGAIAVSDDGTTAASASDDHTIRRWRIEADAVTPTGAEIRGHANNVKAIAIVAGGIIITASKDSTVRRWRADNGEPIADPLPTSKNPESQGQELWAVAASRDGSMIAAAGSQGLIYRWSGSGEQQLAGALQPLPPLHGHTGPIKALAFSPDSKTLVSAGTDRQIRRWRTDDGSPIGEPLAGHDDVIEAIAFSSDSKIIVSGGRDRTIRLWDAGSGEPIGSPLHGHEDQIRAVAVSPDGRKIASAGRDRTVRLWDLRPGPAIGPTLPGHGQVARMTLSPNGAVIASTGQDYIIRLWDAASGEPVAPILVGHTDEVRSLAFSPDGAKLASGAEDDSVRLWNAVTGAPIWVAPGDESGRTGHSAEVFRIAISPDRKQVVSGSFDGTIRRWAINTGEPIGNTITLHNSGDIRDLAISPDSSVIASASGDVAQLWDATTGKQIQLIRLSHGMVDSIAISPDSRMITTGGSDRTVRRWDLRTGRPIGRPLLGHTSRTQRIAFDPTGKEIISVDQEGSAFRWEAATGTQIGEPLRGYIDFVANVALSPGGTHLGAARPDGSLSIFPARLDHWIHHACNLAGRNLTPQEWNAYVGTEHAYVDSCAQHKQPR